MRKAFMIALLAAGAAMPAGAMAQDGDSWRGRAESRQQNRSERQQTRQENRQENRAERQQTRQEQPAPQQRQERQQARQERQQARQQQPVVQQRQEVRQERRQERAQQSGQGWLGDRNDPRMEEHRRRYERLDRQNARENGTREQYRSVVEQQGSQRVARREDRRDTRNDRRDDRRDWRNDRRDDRQDWRRDNRQNRGSWNRGWRNDNRYDWQRYRNSNRFAFRVQPYYSPYRGYGYQRFGIGSILDSLFFGRNYWISDPWQYRLPPAPYGYQWVRYYGDVVLVDTYTGEIVDVIHDFFW